MKLLPKILLYPLSLLYKGITSFRNHLFNIGYTRSFSFEVPVINIGNLTVGGTGKSPHVEYLITLLKNRYKIATLSRGYGRKTKGFILADDSSDADTIGDEPLQFYKKFSPDISVAVCEDRVYAVPVILFERPATQVMLLDDAYQHRYVTPDLNILLTDFHRPFYEDMLLPSGRLRESRSGAGRADLIVVTKCPDDLPEHEMERIRKRIGKYAGAEKPVFFSGLKYREPVSFFNQGQTLKSKNILVFSGIASPELFEKKAEENFQVVDKIRYADHHVFSIRELSELKEKFTEHTKKADDLALLTTEKDMVRLLHKKYSEALKGLPLFYYPIEVYFLKDKQKFDDIILHTIKSKNA